MPTDDPFGIDYRCIPEGLCRDALRAYVEQGRPVAERDFLEAVLLNDLVNAFGRADTENLPRIRDYVVWMWNEAPSSCWGSKEKVEKWVAQGGLGKGVHGVA